MVYSNYSLFKPILGNSEVTVEKGPGPGLVFTCLTRGEDIKTTHNQPLSENIWQHLCHSEPGGWIHVIVFPSLKN